MIIVGNSLRLRNYQTFPLLNFRHQFHRPLSLDDCGRPFSLLLISAPAIFINRIEISLKGEAGEGAKMKEVNCRIHRQVIEKIMIWWWALKNCDFLLRRFQFNGRLAYYLHNRLKVARSEWNWIFIHLFSYQLGSNYPVLWKCSIAVDWMRK